MSLLKLDNVGKIYVSEGNVAVGIRGVNLSFDKGEFVAITGESGSGKSTLLNVISGMDTYEEGELYIDGQPTSHYLQPEWEQYRQKYISFIFQDYNIIDSFTVLQNVELALMTIDNPRDRRKRAVELIERVGLKSHMNHKGSQLSGGQKQRTVIARALAKDSPIILADEPTGNLDSKTAQEIVELLREVSVNKLLIVVTHDFDLVENVATRHVRIFDGAVESDSVLRGAETTQPDAETEEIEGSNQTNETGTGVEVRSASNGFRLGRVLFSSKPKLSAFLCFLLVFGMASLFLVTALCSDFTEMFRSFYLFQRTEGRLVIARMDGQPLSEVELEKLQKQYGAQDRMHYDYLWDVYSDSDNNLSHWPKEFDSKYFGENRYTYGIDYGTPDYGRYPEAYDEVFLRLPYYYLDETKPLGLLMDSIMLNGCEFRIVGTRFELDTNEVPTFAFSKEGFIAATTALGMDLESAGYTVDGEPAETVNCFVVASNSVAPYKIYCDNKAFNEVLASNAAIEFTVSGNGIFTRQSNMASSPRNAKSYVTSRVFRNADFTDEFYGDVPLNLRIYSGKDNCMILYVGIQIAEEMFADCLEGVYNQGSLFFASDKEAVKASDGMREEGYMAITTDETYSPSANVLVELVANGVIFGFIWLVTILLIVFVINLCTNRSVEAFRDDLAVMRSMGIPVRVIKIGMYVRMGLALLPALVLIPVMSYLVYHNMTLSLLLDYLKPEHYVILVAALIILTWRITAKQVRNLFSASVKTSLRGGDEQ